MATIPAYLAMLLVFLGIDALWLKWVMKPLFDRHVGHLLADQVRLAVAAGFYLFYVGGIGYFAVLPAGSWPEALAKGALLGLIAYGTYEATNMATLKGWQWSLVIVDLAWGATLTGLVALVGYLVLHGTQSVMP